jgi:hypothetical protein
MQDNFLKRGIYYNWCKETLDNLLFLSNSQFGFICELLQKQDGTPFITSHGISNIAWNKQTRLFYKKHQNIGLEFFNFDSLWGAAINTGKSVIANDPDNDHRRGGYPKDSGHPLLKSFLGLPIKGSDEKVVGVMGVANRPNGFDHDLVDFLRPFVSSYGILIEKYRSDEQRKILENEREELILDLKKSIAQIKKLSGLLPFCSYCKKVRDDKGYWNQIDTYIAEHSDADISHSICPECAKKHYPGLDIYNK